MKIVCILTLEMYFSVIDFLDVLTRNVCIKPLEKEV